MATQVRTARLGDLISVKHGYAFKGEYFSDRGPFVVLTPGNFHEEGGFRSKGEKEKFYAGPVPDEFILKRGDLIVAMTEQAEGLLGSSALVPASGLYLHNQRLGLVRPLQGEQVEMRFLYHLFNTAHVRQQIAATASGVKVRHTSPARIYDVQVALPAIATQRKIATILSAYDDLIENNTRRIKILEKMAQTLYREWFVHFRFPRHQHEKTVQTVAGEVPEGWKVKRLTDCVEVLSGGTPSTAVEEYWNGAIPFFTPRDDPGTFYVEQTARTITQLGLAKCNSQLFPKDTVFITARGTVGKCALAAVPMAMSQTSYALRCRGRDSQLWLYLLVRELADTLRKNATGAVFDAIVVDTFRSQMLAEPPEKLRAQFERLVAPAFALMLNLQRRAANLRQTRDLLLPKLISGEIDVSDLDIDVAGAA